LALLLNIDTATEYAGVCMSKDLQVLAIEESLDQKNHGSFVQPAIQGLLKKLGKKVSDIDAVVVSAGPGSYTGLRVGLSTAKGLCYALRKPLIMINTLEIMAYAAIVETKKQQQETSNFLFCPMIDARRMEVFTALFDDQLNYIISPVALVLTEIPADFFPGHTSIIFSGNGSKKLQSTNILSKAVFNDVQHSVSYLAVLGAKAFEKQQFANIAYSEPIYIKEFFTPQTDMKN